MANNKKGFVLYADVNQTLKHLTNEQAGELFKHLLSYVNDENPVTENPIVNIAFEPIKQQLKRDLQKWKGIKEKRSEAGKKSAEARKKQATNSTKSTSVKSVEQTSTKSTVTVNSNSNSNSNSNIKENKQKTACAEKEALFFNFWETYDKSRNKEKVKTKFFKLKNQEIEKIFETLPDYVKSTPEKKFRKDPLTYLNQKTFEDEIIANTGETGNKNKGVQARLRENIENSKLRGSEPVDWSLL